MASVLENLLPSASRHTSGLASEAETNVLPNQLSRFMNPLARWPVSNSPPFHSPIMKSTVAGCSVSQNASSSASGIWSARSVSAANVLRAVRHLSSHPAVANSRKASFSCGAATVTRTPS